MEDQGKKRAKLPRMYSTVPPSAHDAETQVRVPSADVLEAAGARRLQAQPKKDQAPIPREEPERDMTPPALASSPREEPSGGMNPPALASTSDLPDEDEVITIDVEEDDEIPHCKQGVPSLDSAEKIRVRRKDQE